MRRGASALAAAGLTVAAVVGVDALGDLTQTRPDPPRPGWRSEVVFEVRARNPAHRPAALAQRLWSACAHNAERTILAPGLIDLPGGLARVVVQPSLGRHAHQRLEGCLEDFTLDRARGRVVAVRHLPPPS